MDTLFAGTLSALTVDIAIYPLDTLKSRLQDPKRHIHFPDGKGMSRGLYQGIGPVLVASLPAAGAFFTSYEYGKRVLAHPSSPFSKESNSGLHATFGPAPLHLAASAIGELVSCSILTPAEILKQRAQVVNKELEKDNKGSSGSTKQGSPLQTKEIQSRLQSLRGSYLRGFVSLAGRNLPFTAIQFPLYEHFRAAIGQKVGLKAYTSPEDGTVVLEKPNDSWTGDGTSVKRAINAVKDKVPGLTPDPKAAQPRLSNRDLFNTFLVASGSAAGAGAVAALVTTPIDVAKTNIMLDQSGGGSGSGAKGVFRTMAAVAAREGLVGLMRGGLLRTAWTALGAGLYLGSYETGRQWWNNRA
ncbi:hypothetical protein OC861_002813 [Tilletia horrida]|nr:hypothetical protein OC861_002813 [Tilletia horrida]